MWVRVVLLLILASAVGYGTVQVAQQWLAQERERAARNVPATIAAPPPAPAAGRAILVAAADLELGHLIRPEDLSWQAWPDAALAPSYIEEGRRDITEFHGAVIRSRVAAGEPLTDHLVVRPGERGFLAAVLGPGMRAVAVPIDQRTGIAGLIFPGDRVDVMMTYVFRIEEIVGPDGRPRRASTEGIQYENRVTTETVLLDIRVLAIDQNTRQFATPNPQPGQAPAEPRGPGGGSMVTVEVTPQQAEFLTIAQQMMAQRSGSLSLSLRSLTDPNQPAVVSALEENGGIQLVGNTAHPGEEKFFGTAARAAPTERRTFSVDSDFSLLLAPLPTGIEFPEPPPVPQIAASEEPPPPPPPSESPGGTVLRGDAAPLGGGGT